MTRKEWALLKPGDKCIVSKRLNKDRTVVVTMIFDEFVTVRTADGKRFNLASNSTAFYETETFNYKSLNLA